MLMRELNRLWCSKSGCTWCANCFSRHFTGTEQVNAIENSVKYASTSTLFLPFMS